MAADLLRPELWGRPGPADRAPRRGDLPAGRPGDPPRIPLPPAPESDPGTRGATPKRLPTPVGGGMRSAKDVPFVRPGWALPEGGDMAPSGTDPDVWSLLSLEERLFFQQPGDAPVLQYTRTRVRHRPEPPQILGARLDVRI